MKYNLLLFLQVLSSTLSFSQTLTLNIEENFFKIDEERSLIISHFDNINDYNGLSSFEKIVIAFNKNEFVFNEIPARFDYTSSYAISQLSKKYTLYFTQLPIVSIESPDTIINEPKVLANFFYAYDGQVIDSKIGIELRGGNSLNYSKKTFDLEFWEDEMGNQKHKVQFLNLRSDDDWILDGLYNEPLRLRSFVANKLWLQMNQLYYQEQEPKAKAGADVAYVELFLNGSYNGLYKLSEQIDRKQLKLKTFSSDETGELYKGVSWGGTTFSALPSYSNQSRSWGGYEIKYPKAQDETNWKKLYDFTDFVLYSSDEDFQNQIWTKFSYENFIDYFIFLNLLRATDNTGKNIYLAKYNINEPYYYVPWDLDGCFGTDWSGSNDDITNDILTNGLLERVINFENSNYAETIAKQWLNYRDNILETTTLIEMFEDQYQFFFDNKVYERESLVYPNYQYNKSDLNYLVSWIQNRLNFLDIYFNELILSEETPQSSETIFPNPSNDRFFIMNSSHLKGQEYRLYDMSTNLIKTGTFTDAGIEIDMLSTGVYILKMSENSYKLIVK